MRILNKINEKHRYLQTHFVKSVAQHPSDSQSLGYSVNTCAFSLVTGFLLFCNSILPHPLCFCSLVWYFCPSAHPLACCPLIILPWALYPRAVTGGAVLCCWPYLKFPLIGLFKTPVAVSASGHVTCVCPQPLTLQQPWLILIHEADRLVRTLHICPFRPIIHEKGIQFSSVQLISRV